MRLGSLAIGGKEQEKVRLGGTLPLQLANLQGLCKFGQSSCVLVGSGTELTRGALVVASLSIYYTNITGPLPSEIGLLTELRTYRKELHCAERLRLDSLGLFVYMQASWN